MAMLNNQKGNPWMMSIAENWPSDRKLQLGLMGLLSASALKKIRLSDWSMDLFVGEYPFSW
jgi:hypothetical protein